MQETNAKLTERKKRIYNFINKTSVGVLASVDPNGEPHASVIYHCINKNDFTISFLTKKNTKKYDNLTHKNHVILVIFDLQTQTVAQVFGRTREVTDPDDINSIATLINKVSVKISKNTILPIAKLEAGEFAAFTISPFQIRMACYVQPHSGDYSPTFDSIESFELNSTT
jgi:uncharacterized protein YhbP (UPF0306 family)